MTTKKKRISLLAKSRLDAEYGSELMDVVLLLLLSDIRNELRKINSKNGKR
jgi:hypothetical protein